MPSFVSRSKTFILDLLSPIFCLKCRKEGVYLCENCQNGLKIVPPTCFVCKKLALERQNPQQKSAGIEIIYGRTCKTCRNKSLIYGFLSPLCYPDPLVRDLIHGLKYNGIRPISKILAEILTNYFTKYRVSMPADAIIIPIPLHKKRERNRGFNQAVLIGEHVSKLLKLELDRKNLVKTKKTRPQMELSAEERRNNLSGTFALREPAALKNKTVLLLDDVKTTGATLEEAAHVLKSAGARRVWAVTVAH